MFASLRSRLVLISLLSMCYSIIIIIIIISAIITYDNLASGARAFLFVASLRSAAGRGAAGRGWSMLQ